MKYTEIKNLVLMTDRDSVEAYLDNTHNDTNYTIRTEEQAIQAVYDSYRDDLYMLGCFNANFIVDYICLDTDTIKTLQEAEAFEGIGKAIMDSGTLRP